MAEILPQVSTMRRVQGIIALDLDGTLLNSQKRLSTRNLNALETAAEDGWEIVPTTGRFYNGMPDFIRELPFIHYAITINGAEVEDLRNGKIIYKAEMPWQQAADIMEWLDDAPVIYDCYMRSAGWMSESHKERIDSIVYDPHYRGMLRDLRQSVPDLKAFIRAEQTDVQKVQFFTKDPVFKLHVVGELEKRFKGLAISSAMEQNMEINHEDANKGAALLALAKYIGIDPYDTMAIGDGLNDLPMIKAAGMGVAMSNAVQEVKEKARWVTLSNDMDGVAAAIEKYCL